MNFFVSGNSAIELVLKYWAKGINVKRMNVECNIEYNTCCMSAGDQLSKRK